MTTGVASHTRTYAASRIDSGVFEPPICSIFAALCEDLRTARSERGREVVHNAIAMDCEVLPNTVYTWTNDKHIWTTDQIKSVVLHTGGRHLIAYLQRLGANVLGADVDGTDIAEAVAELVVSFGRINAQVARDMSPGDDTPCVLDDDELDRIDVMLDQSEAQQQQLRSMVKAARQANAARRRAELKGRNKR